MLPLRDIQDNTIQELRFSMLPVEVLAEDLARRTFFLGFRGFT
jgi:hypothetical protein